MGGYFRRFWELGGCSELGRIESLGVDRVLLGEKGGRGVWELGGCFELGRIGSLGVRRVLLVGRGGGEEFGS